MAFDTARTDRGTLRHPVFGNREVWVNQPVKLGWWSRPVEESRDDIVKATDDAVGKIIKSMDLD
jgi:hypothetical protein